MHTYIACLSKWPISLDVSLTKKTIQIQILSWKHTGLADSTYSYVNNKTFSNLNWIKRKKKKEVTDKC